MAYFDQTLLLSNAQAITSTAPSTTIYDVSGAGAGNATNLIIGNASVLGVDMGAGDGIAKPVAYFTVGTTFTTSNAATLQIQIQAAIDNGSNSPASYTTIVETDALAATVLVAGNNIQIDLPPVTFAEAYPRFYRFNYVVGTGIFTAGAMTGGILLNPPEGKGGTLYASNFKSTTA